MNVKRYSVASLFSGLGGLDLGFIWEGFDIVWACDSNENTVRSYNLNFEQKACLAELSSFPEDEIPDVDVIIGGPPCQSFSLVGQRRPDDPRSALVSRFFDIVKAKRPNAFVMENVPGITAFRVGGQRLIQYLADSFQKLGYHVSIMKLNAVEYLVPQRRRRVVLVGCLSTKVPKPNGVRFAKELYDIEYSRYDFSSKAAIGDLGPCVAAGEPAMYKREAPSEFAHIMRQKSLESVTLHEMPRMSETDQILVSHIPPGGNYQDVPDEVAPGRILKFKKTGGRTTTYGRLHPDKPAYTINTYFRRPNVGCNFHYAAPRLITPREAMRFQSIPDYFELVYSSQDGRNALIGNAVPPLMSRALAWSLREVLEKTP